jgi:uncharacterized membrane protein
VTNLPPDSPDPTDPNSGPSQGNNPQNGPQGQPGNQQPPYGYPGQDPNGQQQYGGQQYSQAQNGAPQYGQPQYAQQPPQTDPVSLVLTNYWLSVFFTWIPALIFYLVDRGKNPQSDRYHAANLNFSLLRIILIVATQILAFIPFIGLVFLILGGICNIILFIFHIVAAAKASSTYRRGEPPAFVFNTPMVK